MKNFEPANLNEEHGRCCSEPMELHREELLMSMVNLAEYFIASRQRSKIFLKIRDEVLVSSINFVALSASTNAEASIHSKNQPRGHEFPIFIGAPPCILSEHHS